MSVENMTEVSFFLLAAAGILAAVAVVMFFAFNIPRCFRMVSGRLFVREPKKAQGEKRQPKRQWTEALSRSGATMPLAGDTAEGTVMLGGGTAMATAMPMETLMLDGDKEEAFVSDVNGLEIVQDIAYKDDGTTIA